MLRSQRGFRHLRFKLNISPANPRCRMTFNPLEASFRCQRCDTIWSFFFQALLPDYFYWKFMRTSGFRGGCSPPGAKTPPGHNFFYKMKRACISQPALASSIIAATSSTAASSPPEKPVNLNRILPVLSITNFVGMPDTL